MDPWIARSLAFELRRWSSVRRVASSFVGQRRLPDWVTHPRRQARTPPAPPHTRPLQHL